MSALEMLSEIIKLCKVTKVEIAPHEHHLHSRGVGTQSSQLCRIMKALGAFCEGVQDVLYSGAIALQCQNKAESTHVPLQVSKAETREGQVWQSPLPAAPCIRTEAHRVPRRVLMAVPS